MRDYAKIIPAFWIKGSGKRLRGCPEAQVVGLYLVSCPSSNMIGLYYLPKSLLVHETGLGVEGAERGLRKVIEARFAFYDEDEEVVWVPNGAAYQIGERLTGRDPRKVGVMNELLRYKKHPFAKEFLRRYADPFGLPSELPGSGSEAASMLLPSQEQDQDQDQDQEQEQEGTRPHRTAPRETGAYKLPDDWSLTAERLEVAKMAPVDSPEAVARKFRQIAIEKGWLFDAAGWEARWQRFCDDERQYQQRQRYRAQSPGAQALSGPARKPIAPLPARGST